MAGYGLSTVLTNPFMFHQFLPFKHLYAEEFLFGFILKADEGQSFILNL